jgi:iron complex transport system substrate-binding protein
VTSFRLRTAVSGLVLAIPILFSACTSAATPATTPTPTPAPTAAPATVAAPATPTAVTTPVPATTPAPTPAPTAAALPLTITDDEGTAVSLPARPERIVSLTPATTETLFAVGAGARLVGRTDADDYPAAAASVPVVVSMGKVDVEKIVGARPDLVLAGGNFLTPPDVIARLRSLGISVVVVYAPSVDGVLHDIELVAAAAGAGPAGAAITASMRERIAAITAAASTHATKPRVFYEIDATKEIYGPADKSFVASMIVLAGGDPVTTGSSTVWSIPLEKLVVADPQVILLADAAYGATADQVAARSGWHGMAAVKAGAVRPVDDTLVTRPGPRLADGLAALAKAIDPTLVLPAPSPSASH